MQINWTDLADRDLDEIEVYITKSNNPRVAVDVILRIVTVTELMLTNHPNSGRLGRHKGTRELIVDRVPFIVIYRITGDQIHVLRVLHDSQQWPSAN